MTKCAVKPCHRPMTTMVPKPIMAPWYFVRRLPLSTTKMCSRIQSVRETCQLRQNCVMLAALSGFLKFSGTFRPMKPPRAMAMSA